jgi:hypothetical protein
VELTMKTIVKNHTIRALIALMTLASSAFVLEAGQRWR